MSHRIVHLALNTVIRLSSHVGAELHRARRRRIQRTSLVGRGIGVGAARPALNAISGYDRVRIPRKIISLGAGKEDPASDRGPRTPQRRFCALGN